jgi:hypothetical protein
VQFFSINTEIKDIRRFDVEIRVKRWFAEKKVHATIKRLKINKLHDINLPINNLLLLPYLK